jgi:type 1 glutamine amidotransferase/HEAT repeat protein
LKPNEAQQKALLDFVLKDGKAWIGIHSATDNFPQWKEGQALLGGKFAGHPWGGGDTSAVKLDDPQHPLNKPFGGVGFWIKDEIYQMDDNYQRGDRRILLSLDMSKPQNERPWTDNLRKDRDIGISWIKTAGNGRIFYSSFGHNHLVFWQPQIIQHWLDGIQFALGDYKVDATPLAAYTPALAPGLAVTWEQERERKAADDELCRWFLEGEGINFLKKYQTGTDDRIATKWLYEARRLDAAGRKKVEELIVSAGDQFTPAGKVVSADVLGKFGGAPSVSLLAGWAQDKERRVSDAAIAALAMIPAPVANAALVKLLPNVTDAQKAAILGDLKEKRDPSAVQAATQLLRSDDQVVSAALFYLAGVASDSALGIVSGYKPANDALKDVRGWALVNGGLRAAQEGRAPVSAAVFKSLLGGANSVAVRLAAAQGLLQVEGAAAVKGSLASLLQDKSVSYKGEIFNEDVARELAVYPAVDAKTGVVLGLLTQIPYPAPLAVTLGQSFGTYSEEVQLTLVRNIVSLQLGASFQVLLDAALNSGSAPVQLAALEAVGNTGNEKYFSPLSAALADKDEERVKAAVSGLSKLQGKGVAKSIEGGLLSADDAVKARWLKIIGLRADPATLPLVMEQAKSKNREVREAAFGALKGVTSANNLPLLAELQKEAASNEEKKGWREALMKVAGSLAGDSKAIPVLVSLTEAYDEGEELKAIARSLALINNNDATSALNKLLGASEPGKRKEIIRGIGNVRNKTVLAVLEKDAAEGADDTEKILALRSLIEVSREIKQMGDDDRVKIWDRAYKLATRDEEKEGIANNLKNKKGNGNARKLMDELGIEYK